MRTSPVTARNFTWLTNATDEILLSKDKTVAIIDGSGVLYDPAGLDRSELVRLAKARKPINFFAKEKLGPEGYQILVDQKDIQLPCTPLSSFSFGSSPPC